MLFSPVCFVSMYQKSMFCLFLFVCEMTVGLNYKSHCNVGTQLVKKELCRSYSQLAYHHSIGNDFPEHFGHLWDRDMLPMGPILKSNCRSLQVVAVGYCIFDQTCALQKGAETYAMFVPSSMYYHYMDVYLMKSFSISTSLFESLF